MTDGDGDDGDRGGGGGAPVLRPQEDAGLEGRGRRRGPGRRGSVAIGPAVEEADRPAAAGPGAGDAVRGDRDAGGDAPVHVLGDPGEVADRGLGVRDQVSDEKAGEYLSCKYICWK